jgi:hypothetical protein
MPHVIVKLCLYAPHDIRFEDLETPRIEQPTDAVGMTTFKASQRPPRSAPR